MKNQKSKKYNVEFENLTLETAVAELKKALDTVKKLNDSIEELTAKLSDATTKIAEVQAVADSNKDSWYRAAAEFENFKKRNAETRLNAYFDGKKDAILSLLIVGDSVDRALGAKLDEKTRAGVELIKKQFTETLTALGVEELNPEGQAFDPTVAEAIATVDCAEGEQPDTVKTVYKKGYKLGGKMIRYAQVIVCK